nr:YpmA family protein [Mesobacillus boroniphilus]
MPVEHSYINDKNCVGGVEAGVESKIEVISTVKVQNSPDLYKIVDALNRTLKREDLMFGLALDQDDKEKAIFTIYRT